MVDRVSSSSGLNLVCMKTDQNTGNARTARETISQMNRASSTTLQETTMCPFTLLPHIYLENSDSGNRETSSPSFGFMLRWIGNWNKIVPFSQEVVG